MAQPFVEATVSGLTEVTNSRLLWLDVDLDGDLDLLVSGNVDDGTAFTQLLTYDESAGFTATSGAFRGITSGALSAFDLDNDNRPDVLLSGWTGSNRFTSVYRNVGEAFEESGSSIAPVYFSAQAVADFEHDGQADAYLSGSAAGGLRTFYYRNQGGALSFSEEVFPQVVSPILSVCDYDSDGYADLFYAGQVVPGDVRSQVLSNDGAGSLSLVGGLGITGVYAGSADWGDFDSDGHDDLLITGNNDLEGNITELYRNQGDGTFTSLNAVGLPTLRQGSGQWGDYDGDGDLDILLCGAESGNVFVTRIYENANDSDFGFAEAEELTFPGVFQGEARWADFDRDGDLDFALCGKDSDDHLVTHIYVNQASAPNARPLPPRGLTAETDTLVGNLATLRWEAGQDGAETSELGLTYSLAVVPDTLFDGQDTVYIRAEEEGSRFYQSPLADLATGTRYTSGPGNVWHARAWASQEMSDGVYRFYVQSVDNSFRGSAFSEPMEFTVVTPVALGSAPSLCGQDTLRIGSAGQNVRWYADSTLTQRIGAGDTLEILPLETLGQLDYPVELTLNADDPENAFLTGTVYATQTINGKEGLPASVDLQIYPKPVPPEAGAEDYFFCSDEQERTVSVTGMSLRWYADPAGNDLVTSGVSSLSVNTNTPSPLYVTQSIPAGLCESDPVTVEFTIVEVPDWQIAFSQAQQSLSVPGGAGVTFFWTYEGQRLGAFDNQTTIPQQGEGVYSVSGQTQEGCAFETPFYTVSLVQVGIEGAAARPSLDLWPNPATETLRFGLRNEWEGPTSVSVFSLTGERLRHARYDKQGGTLEASVDVSGLPASLYLFAISSEGRHIVRRFAIR